MLLCTDEFIRWSGLDIQNVLQWRKQMVYRAKSDKPPAFSLMQKPMKPILIWDINLTSVVIGRNRSQSCVTSTLHYAPLPIMMKVEAIRLIAVAKIQHLFPKKA